MKSNKIGYIFLHYLGVSRDGSIIFKIILHTYTPRPAAEKAFSASNWQEDLNREMSAKTLRH